MEPLYSVPIQTTATLNIQLLMQKGSSSSSDNSRQPVVQQSSGPVTLIRAPASSSVSSTRVNIVAEVPIRPSYPADDASSSFGTQTDFGGRGIASSHGSFITAGTDSYSAPARGGAATVNVSGNGTLQTSMGSSSSSSSAQTGSVTDSSSQYGFLAARSSSLQTGFSDSASQCCFPDPMSPSRSSDSSSQCGSSTLTSVSSSSGSGLRGDVDDDVGSEYRVFTDADGGTGCGTGSDKAVSKLAQGVQMSLGMNDGGGAGSASDWKTTDEEEDDDSDSGESWEELGKPAVPTSFNVIEWNLPNEKSPKSMACSRVIIMKDKDMILMIKVLHNCN